MKPVKIGNQTWNAENLNIEQYRNGDIIPEVQDKDEWTNLTTGAWCYYDNKNENGKNHGKLYNWHAVNDPRGLAPKGWHIPTIEEFEILVSNVENYSNPLKALREGEGNGAGTNESGFSALLSGYRNDYGGFDSLNDSAYYWSSTEIDEMNAYYLQLYYNNNSVYINSIRKGSSFNIRLIKD